MEFLKSVLIGLIVILLLLILTGLNKAGGFEAIGLIFILIFIAPVILLFSIIIGIKRQSVKQETVPGNKSFTLFNVKFSKGFYLSILTILILCILFIILFFPYIILPILK